MSTTNTIEYLEQGIEVSIAPEKITVWIVTYLSPEGKRLFWPYGLDEDAMTELEQRLEAAGRKPKTYCLKLQPVDLLLAQASRMDHPMNYPIAAMISGDAEYSAEDLLDENACRSPNA